MLKLLKLPLGCVIGCIFTAAPILAADEPPKPQPIVAVKAGHLVDTAAGALRENQLIVIEGDKVKAVGRQPISPSRFLPTLA